MPFACTIWPLPIVGAPMAGGPSTPALAAAVSDAGGLGYLAAGYLSRRSGSLRTSPPPASLTGGPIGVNLFVPQPCMRQRR